MNIKNIKILKLTLLITILIVTFIVPIFQATFFVTVKSSLLNLVVDGLDFFKDTKFVETRDIPALLSLSVLLINSIILLLNFKRKNVNKINRYLCGASIIILITLQALLKKYTFNLAETSLGFYLLIILLICFIITSFLKVHVEQKECEIMNIEESSLCDSEKSRKNINDEIE